IKSSWLLLLLLHQQNLTLTQHYSLHPIFQAKPKVSLAHLTMPPQSQKPEGNVSQTLRVVPDVRPAAENIEPDRDNHSTELTQLQEALRAKEAEYFEKDAKLREVDAKCRSLTLKLTSSSFQLDEWQGLTRKLGSQLTEQREKNTELEARFASAEKCLLAREEELGQLSKSNNLLKSRASFTAESCKTLALQVEHVRDVYVGLQATKAKLEEKVKDQAKQLEAQEKYVDWISDGRARTEKKLEESEAKLKLAQAECARSREERLEEHEAGFVESSEEQKAIIDPDCHGKDDECAKPRRQRPNEWVIRTPYWPYLSYTIRRPATGLRSH
ncbi:hypothetical protein FB567DRAFT_616167, partial [Paraphoma chrysanthemicola]